MNHSKIEVPEIIDVQTFIGEWVGVDANSTVDDLLVSMKHSSIAKAVALTTNSDDNGSVRNLVARYRDRLLFGFWFLPDQDHLDYLKNHLNEIALVKFHPSYAKVRLDDPKMIGLLKFCEQEQLPILVHCGRWREMAGYDIALAVAERYEAKILLAHMGGVSSDLVKMTVDALKERKVRNAFLVTSGMAIGTSIWLERCPSVLIEYAVKSVGANRVLFGSDFPFGTMEGMVKAVLEAHLERVEREQVLAGNARRILHLPQEGLRV